MKRLLILFLIPFVALASFASDSPKIQIEGKVNYNETPLERVEVTIYNEDYSLVIEQKITDDRGKYDLIELDMGSVYIMEVKKKGYVVKRILIDAREGYIEDEAPLYIPLIIPFELHPNKLIKKKKEVKSKEFFIGKLSIDPATAGLTPDMKFVSEQKKFYNSHRKK